MLMKRDEGGEVRPSWEEPEAPFDDLSRGMADGTISRSRAIKLAGAALVGSALTLFLPDAAEGLELEAEHRRRRRRRRRRRQRRHIRHVRNACLRDNGAFCRQGNKVACCRGTLVGTCAQLLNGNACIAI